MTFAQLLASYFQSAAQKSPQVIATFSAYSAAGWKNVTEMFLEDLVNHSAANFSNFLEQPITDIFDDTRVATPSTILVLNSLSEPFFSISHMQNQNKNQNQIRDTSSSGTLQIILTDQTHFSRLQQKNQQQHDQQRKTVKSLSILCMILNENDNENKNKNENDNENKNESENIQTVVGQLCSVLAGHPTKSLEVYGITGTNGKTTVASLLYHSWLALGIPAAMIGTLGCYWSLGSTSRTSSNRTSARTTSSSASASPPRPSHQENHIQTGYTTPRPAQLQRLFEQLLCEGIRKVAIEVSSEALVLGRVAGCQFSAAIFTNLSPEHLDVHQNMDNYFTAKRQLLIQTQQKDGWLIIDTSNPWGKRMAGDFASYDKKRTMTTSSAWLDAINQGISHALEKNPKKKLFFHETNRRNLALALLADPVLTRFFVEPAKNAPATETAAASIRDQQAYLVQSLPLISGRFECIESGIESSIESGVNGQAADEGREDEERMIGIVDYAHTPAALENALLQARKFSVFLICVFGCGGNRDQTKREKMGAIATKIADQIIVCDDNPRHESSAAIRQQILKGCGSSRKHVQEIGDRKKAIFQAVKEAQKIVRQTAPAAPATPAAPAVQSESVAKYVTILVAGKGHESLQIIQGKHFVFSDQQVLRDAFAAQRRPKPATQRRPSLS